MSDDDSKMELIGRIKAGLSDREMQVLKVRFGVDFSGGTNEEILAAMLEITQEKIQKIARKALKRLKGKDGS